MEEFSLLDVLIKNESKTKNDSIAYVNVYSFPLWTEGWMTWMTCDFTSSSTVFQSYQDDG